MWLLIPLIILALLAILLGVAVAAVVAVMVKLGPILLILLGIWLLARALFGPGGRRQAPGDRRARPAADRRHRTAAVVARPPVQPTQSEPRPGAAPRRELPIDVQIKADQIRHKADMLLGYADRFPPFSQGLHIVRQTAADYLPRTVEAYLRLPGVDEPLVASRGKTALDELREQLELLDSKLDEIAQDLQRQDLERMLANRRFLEERFRLRDEAAGPGSVPGPAADGTEAA